ncbi:MAG: type II toxin-antitoxin system RelE/ParE family toxin [Deltaproteobacteria bacterium]|jgi:toxin ParE1/3/4|nr:type II toxin-antitoxin system RelE/ParE family toxin [Deltaproteobacteria bacterium]MBT7483464.1 type II toxin-antitoxin system RelE/ParE family toxin [Candidatus Peregrinibacteria bacterium]MBT4266867.1 type II toxin-antitoxin system RelE/ParE family toxin [Deltaproteobacteria bacterium]MBT4640313.1 type II toxin-antitoxin system RelE/ParE family toxin [Deltaproteobacteria bacterium]MBT6501898.1 type II toxin-antitoxin system RelE/ParE family toxin [Deltaproteobacteria bacterium]
MAGIIITPAAENDLADIWLFIAKDNPQAADRVFEAAQTTFDSLLEQPKMGKIFESKRKKLKGICFFPIGEYPKYIVYYRETSNGIEVVRVLHSRMLREGRLLLNDL